MGLPAVAKLSQPDSSLDQIVNAFLEAILELKLNSDDSYLLAFESVWNECAERFKEIGEF